MTAKHWHKNAGGEIAKAVANVIKEDMWEYIKHVSVAHDMPEKYQCKNMLLLNMNDLLISWFG
jgi:hypothetical protein